MENNASGTATLTVGNSTNQSGTFAGVLQNGATGTLALTKAGSGSLTLSGTNTYTGATTVSVGTLKLGSAGALGSTTGNTIVASGATLDLLGQTIGAEALTLSGTGISLGGALINSDGTAASLSGAITLAADSSVGTVSQLTLSGIISESSAVKSLTKVGAGIVILSGNNTYTGLTTISAGTLKLGAAGALGNTSGVSVTNAATLDLAGITATASTGLTLNGTGVASGGALTNSSATSATYSGLLTLGSASSIDASSGNIVLSHAGTISGSGFGLTLDGSANGSSLASIIGTGTGSVTKNGSGHWTLSGTNTYTGTTTVNAGTLYVSGSLASGSAVSVSGGGTLHVTGTVGGTVGVASGALLSGSGTVGGLVSVASGGSITAGDGSTGTLTISGGLTFGSTSGDTGTINIGTLSGYTGSTAAVAVGGTLTLSGGASKVTLALPNGGSFTTGGVYHLIQYTGTFSNDAGFTYTGALPNNGANRQYGSLSNDTTGKYINYSVTGDSPVWSGATSGVWTTDTLAVPGASNWALQNGHAATDFWVNDSVQFNDTVNIGGTIAAPSRSAVSIANGGVTPTAVVFNNSVVSYTVSAINTGIAGTGTLTKNGSATLSLSNANSYSGGSTLNAGALEMGNNSALGSGQITLNGGTLSSDSTTAHSLTNTLLFGGDVTLGGGSGKTGALTFSNGVNLSVVTPTLTVPSGNVVTFSGTVTDVGSGLVKAGAGTLSLTHANTYTGGTLLSAGVIQVGNATALGTGLLTLNGGTLSSDGGTARTLANNLVLGGAVTLGHETNNGVLTFSGTLDLDGSTHTITTASNVEFSGTVSGSNGGLSKDGTGTLTLSGTNSFTSDVSLNAGTLAITSANSLGAAGGMLTFTGDSTLQTNADISVTRGYVINSGKTATINTNGFNLTNAGVISDTVVSTVGGSLTKTGTGTLTLTGDNSYSGITTISGGTLKIGDAGGDGSLSASASVLNNSALVYHLAGTATFGKIISGSGTFTKSGAGTLTLTGATNSWGGHTTISAGTLQLGDGTTDSSIASSSGITITTSSSLVFNVAGSSSYSHVIDGAGSLTKTGAGALTLSDGNSYTGGTTLVSGTLILAGSTSMGASSGILTFAGNGILQSDASRTGSRAWHINADATANIDTHTYTLTRTAGVTSGAGGLNVFGGGTMLMNSANDYTGPTTISGATLSIAADTGLGTAPTLPAVPGQLILNGGTLTTTASFTLNSNRGIELQATSTFDVATGTTLTYGGIMMGAGGLNKSGAGTLELFGRNLFDGPITLNAGTITIDSGASLGDYGSSFGSLTFAGNATEKLAANVTTSREFVLNTGITGTIDTVGFTMEHDGVISGLGGLAKAGTGTLILDGTNTFTGATTISGGTLALGEAGSLNSGSYAGTIANAGVLHVGTTANQTLSGVISGSGSLTKDSSGTLTVTGANSFSGKTTVASGTLAFNSGNASAGADQALGHNAAVDLGVAGNSSGTLQYTGGAATLAKNINALGNGSDTIQNNGSGLLTLTGTLTKNGTVLTLAGGSSGITVTGPIVGASANSDLVISGGTTTLAAVNTYDGPTFIANGATLNASVAGALPTSTRSDVIMDASGSGSSNLTL
ncbi:MAG: autotransporter-associated beta strand repeat-containing protein, partial [Verrucomicrobiota bacterium]